MPYSINDEVYQIDDPALPAALRNAYEEHKRPLCLCVPNGLPMYVAHAYNRYLLKRMPGTGDLHSADCESFESFDVSAGLTNLQDAGAVKEDPDNGTLLLRFGFRLTSSGKQAQQERVESESTSAKTDGGKLSLRGLLDLLWTKAKFNTWKPGFLGKRNWNVIHHYLMNELALMRTGSTDMTSVLYVPPFFNRDEKLRQQTERTEFYADTRGSRESNKKLKMLLGEIKIIRPLREGEALVFRHVPERQFVLPVDLDRRMRKRYQSLLELWSSSTDSHLIALCTLGVSSSGLYIIDELTLMLVDKNWLPYERQEDADLTQLLVDQQRSFTKPMYCTRPRTEALPMASLHDTGLPEYNFFLYIDEKTLKHSSIDHYIAACGPMADKFSCVWTAAVSPMPPIPPKGSLASLASELREYRVTSHTIAEEEDGSEPHVDEASHVETADEEAESLKVHYGADEEPDSVASPAWIIHGDEEDDLAGTLPREEV